MAKRHGPRTPVVLIVLDGWGFRPGREGNAVELGRTPTWHRLWAKAPRDRKSTHLNSSHDQISYAVFCLKKKKTLPRSAVEREADETAQSMMPARTHPAVTLLC